MIPRRLPFRFIEIFAFPNLFAMVSLYIYINRLVLTFPQERHQQAFDDHVYSLTDATSQTFGQTHTVQHTLPTLPLKNVPISGAKPPGSLHLNFEFLCSPGRLSFFLCPVGRYHSPSTQGSTSISSGHIRKTRKMAQYKINSKIPSQH